MKFWELIAAFSTEKSNVDKILDHKKWKKFRLILSHSETVGIPQNHFILDIKVPFELIQEICHLSKHKFLYYYEETQKKISIFDASKASATTEILNSSEVLIRFGGSKLYEVTVLGSTPVSLRSIEDKIEVISSYKISKNEVLALLRKEDQPLEVGTIISSLNHRKSWVIKEIISDLQLPFNNIEKRNQLLAQHIELYRLKPQHNADLPLDNELLIQVKNNIL